MDMKKEIKELEEMLEKENEFLTFVKYPKRLNLSRKTKKKVQEEGETFSLAFLPAEEEEPTAWEKVTDEIYRVDHRLHRKFNEIFQDKEKKISLRTRREWVREKGENGYGDEIETLYWVITGKIFHHVPSGIKGYDHEILNSKFKVPIQIKYRIEGGDWKYSICPLRGRITMNLAFNVTTFASEANRLTLLKYQELEFAFYTSELEYFHVSHDCQGDAYWDYDLAGHHVSNLRAREDLRFDEVTVDGAVRFILEKKR